MTRTLLGSILGWIAGAGFAAGLLRLTQVVLRELTSPKVFEVEHSTIYLGIVMGAGFGGLCGALIGLAGVLLRKEKDRPKTP